LPDLGFSMKTIISEKKKLFWFRTLPLPSGSRHVCKERKTLLVRCPLL